MGSVFDDCSLSRLSFQPTSQAAWTQRGGALVIPGRFFGHHGWKYHPRLTGLREAGYSGDEPCVRRQVRAGPSTGGHS